MSSAFYDTHEAVKRFKAAGFTDEQAEALTDNMRAAITKDLATKADLANLERRMMMALIAVGGLVIAANKLL